VRMLRQALGGELTGPELEALEGGIDVIGDIAIVKLRESLAARAALVGEAVLRNMKNVKCVYGQEGGIEGDYRLRKLRHLAGEERTETMHRENGLRFKLDVATCYFSPRLSTERLRIADAVEDGERVLNMFAGVGPFSITIAKRKEAKVLSCEANKAACDFHLENNRLNKVERKVEVVRGDAMDLPEKVKERFDRVLMPHPSQSNLFLPAALALAKPGGVVHYYRHVTGRTPEEAKENLAAELATFGFEGFASRKVREIGPRHLELVADLRAP
jgi:tRNA (guanine37-N1)-methyltransferase